jgi:hypothetical protein
MHIAVLCGTILYKWYFILDLQNELESSKTQNLSKQINCM